MAAIADDLVELVLRVRGLRDGADAARSAESIVRGLRSARDRLRRIYPGRRRPMPEVLEAADWLRRSAYDAPVTDDQRGELEAIAGELLELAGGVRAGA